MTGAGTWQSCNGAGVKLFKPAQSAGDASPPMEVSMSRMSISQGPQSMASDRPGRPSRSPLASLSLNTVPDLRADSPSTLCGDEDNIIYTPPSSASASENEWHTQLQLYSDGGRRSVRTADQIRFSSPLLGYESDRTDFLPNDVQTPCPKKTANINYQGSSRSGATLGELKMRQSNQKPDRPTHSNLAIRQLDFGRTVSKKKRAPKKRTPPQLSEAQQALEALRKTEYPRHQWTESERNLVAVLYRFYAADPSKLTEVFNEVTGLHLKTEKVKAMEVYMRQNGPEAFPFYGAVFACPLEDLNEEYAAIRAVIEKAVDSLGIELERRSTEPALSSGRAKNARSEYTRRRFKNLIRKAQYEHDALSADAPQINSARSTIRLGGFAISAPQGLDELEIDVDEDARAVQTEEPNTVQTGSPSPSPSQPHQLTHLAFRVWDHNSYTLFNEETGFISQMHSIWRGPLLPPPNPETDDGRNCHQLLANLHLNKQGDASAYVSVATSLIQVLNYAKKMTDPQIAVINLKHSKLQERHKQLMASNTLKELKGIGQAQWARYKGWAEIMIWGNVPMDAIIQYGFLSDLETAITGGPTGSLLRNSNDWLPNQTASTLTKKLKARSIPLDRDVARALGGFSNAMGLGNAGVSLQHITEFVQVCVDGWSLNCALVDDIHTRSSFAYTFAIALSSQTFHLQDIMGAFFDGVERGLHNVAFYERRRPSLRRRRS
ncbi:hypothetical protein BU23DRAFT_638071 [Bimuria novae-zelandiae CBS 107.79]|uniref:DUF7587 domain-containing protein n=1 Tax=Bimuria novae-zelandiae CBS 107.79 TaxID=1447943 RepID=A0A6A5VDJ0_9PLEO|nr:hypothetical protein BU23DRAFT_638071 [Bimuria novae-zelandiae CBS 107.79]